MRTSVAIFACLLFLQVSHSLFLVGQGKPGEPISVLCDDGKGAFASSPDGRVLKLRPDADNQSEFLPSAGGPYAVQCGNQTKTVQVAKASPDGLVSAQGGGFAINALIAASCIALAGAIAFFASRLVSGRVEFTKSIEGSIVRLHLRTGKELESIEIEDESAGSLRIGKLQPGKEWAYEFEAPSEAAALPARLSAACGGKRITILSELLADAAEWKKAGGKPSPTKNTGAPRKIPRAP